MTQFCDKRGTCYDCSYSSGLSTTAAECAKCDDSSSPRFMNTYGKCVRCSTSGGVRATADECAKCDDSSTPRVLLENGFCALESCGANQFRDASYGECASCSASYILIATAAECAKCDDSGTPRFMGTGGSCTSCSASYGVSATATECAKCDSSGTPRVLLENGYCVLESCGANQFQTTSGSCYSCSYSSGRPATAAECAKCDDSGTPRYMDGNYCRQCPTSLSSSVLNTQDKCESCHGTWNAGTQKCS